MQKPNINHRYSWHVVATVPFHDHAMYLQVDADRASVTSTGDLVFYNTLKHSEDFIGDEYVVMLFTSGTWVNAAVQNQITGEQNGYSILGSACSEGGCSSPTPLRPVS